MESNSANHRAKVKEAAYPLSPLQQGMLFQHLVAPGSGVDIEQMVCTLPEPIDLGALREAWQRVIERHAVLRTGFRWEGLESPQQEVWANVTVPFASEDWSRLSEEKQKNRLAEFLKTDRLRGFAIHEAPLMRVTVFRTAPQRYEMVWTFHHALLDGRSFPLVLREVFSIYEAVVEKKTAELPGSRPYRDYIDWLAAREPDASENFWRAALKGFTAPTPLVVDKLSATSVETASRQGDRELFLSAETTAALAALAREHELTLNTLLQGAWGILLSRYSGEADVVFGATRACRRSTIEGADNMVGLFINTLPVRVQVPAEAALLSWLRELRAQWIALRPHEHTPLAKVQSGSDVPAGRPLFESILVFENYQLDETLRALGGPWSQRRFRLYEQNGFPITVAVYAGARLGIKIEFDRARFDEETIDRMLGHLQTLLEGFVARPETQLGELRLLTAEEERQLLIDWNRPVLDATADSPEKIATTSNTQLHHLFEAQAASTPENIAVTCEEQRLTYRELNERANQLAHYLRSGGVGPDVIVGICLDRSLELVIGLLGILKAGGAYLPIDLSYPADRLAFMLEDAQAPVLITQTKLLASLPASPARILCLDGDALALLRQQPAANPDSRGTADNLAYVIFTSGSTGKPKGALITHRNVVRLFRATDHWFGFNERDVWTLFHSYAFDFSVWEIWGALLYGGRLVVVPYEVSRSPEAFGELLGRQRVTVLNQTPSAFRQLIQAEETQPLPKPISLRLVIFGGEALELQSLKPWFDRHGDRRPQLVNMYGITETTVHVTHRPLTKNDLAGGSVIGVPITDLQIYILDQRQRPVPIGVPGEMFVGGAGLARGYLNRPELTKERFIVNPFGNQNGSRLYRTGDLARWLPSRDIEYLGRIDHQVKIRGFRIELGEIESVLSSHPSVREAVVLAREDMPGDKRLTAYLVTNGRAPSVAELRNVAKVKLPDYMVPAAFVFLEKLPLTNNGKIDRKALPAPEHQRPELGASYVEPRTEAEKALAAIWAKVLRIERVGVADNYFELGGDSILSIQIVAQARQAGWQLTPKMLFEHQTVAELAAAAPRATVSASEQGLVEGAAPLTPIQHWFFEQELSGLDHYNQAFLFTVSTPLDAALFAQAVEAVEKHHDVLRLRFARIDGGWRQEFGAASSPAPFQTIDFSETPANQQTQAIEAAAAEIQASLDISSSPLWRVVWFDLGARRPGRLFIAIHHLAVDGVSWRILLEDLEMAYSQLRSGKRVQLPPKTTSFQSWAEKLIEFAASNSLAQERGYWRAVSAGNFISLPADGEARGENTEAAVKTVTVALGADATQALLQEVPAVYNTQINDVLVSALALTISQWLGDGALLVELEGHGREEIANGLDLSRTVGWFTSIFPVRLDLAKTADVRRTLLAVKEQLRRIPRRGIGYGVLRYLRGDSELAAQPQAPIIFNYLGQFDQITAGSALFGFARESTGPWHSPQARRRHMLEINSLIVAGKLELRWSYSENFHRQETIQRVAENFLAALRAIIGHCQSPNAGGCSPSDFPLAKLDQAALDRLITDARNVEDIYPLAPIQQLYLTLAAAQRELGFDQWHFELCGRLDAAALQQAWEQVFNRHTILRSAFVAQGLAEPVQIVYRRVKPVWNELDWRNLDAAAQAEKLSELLRADCEQGLDPATPPLTRITLIRLADDRARCVWSHHHLQIDGWSWPLVFQEVSALYEAANEKRAANLAPPRSYREYVAWLQRQDFGGTEKFWRETLRGFTEPTRLPGVISDSPGAAGAFGEKRFTVSAEIVIELQSLARARRVTLGAIIQTAWALLLARGSGRSDVVFGGTYSGRPADLPGVDAIVGPFVNNLPVRVAVAEDDRVADLLERIHARNQELGQHQFTPLVEIQKWSEVPARHRLFNSLLVFQNYSVNDAASRLGRGVEIRDFTAPVRTNYPLTLVATPATELELNLIYQGDHAGAAAQILEHLNLLLRAIPSAPNQPVKNLLAQLPAGHPTSAPSRKALLAPRNFVAPKTEMERAIARVWQEAFQIERVGAEENFFDLGGHSLLMVQVHARLRAELGTDLPIVTMFQYPTIRALAKHLSNGEAAASSLVAGARLRAASSRASSESDAQGAMSGGIAIIGLAGRFPGAENVEEFWRNLAGGVESISTFSDEELAASGLDVAALKRDPSYVRARGILKDPEYFDAAFFGMNPREAEVTDPQQRVFLETVWAALEDAGYDPARYPGAIGVYAGMSNNTYYLHNLLGRRDLTDAVGWLTTMMGNEKDYLATRVAYKLNLRGPALNVYTACSTSLVAVAQACDALKQHHCDMALAGGVSITFPQARGYQYQEGGITSPDGHCRAFDTRAQGTVFSSGLGVVVLKRLQDALADGDQIHAVIRGAALNNDGSSKVSFTAPSVDGHTEVIALAQAIAGVEPESISYVETHGTGTPLGDPIEIAGLTTAFRAGTAAKNFCAIGSVKTNIGHLDAAAGVAGLIKTTLALRHQQIPASLHFTEPNPKLNLGDSPFYVNAQLREWPAGSGPRRAGVSSFGVGGTNAHAIVEEAPAAAASGPSRAWQLLLLSARTPAALDRATANLQHHLAAHPGLNLADAAFTLQTGRAEFAHRRMLVYRDADDAAKLFATPASKQIATQHVESKDAPVVFIFPGQGAQYVNMGRELYASEEVFRAEVDRCAEILRPHLGLDLREVIFPSETMLEAAKEQLGETRFTQPSLFVIEYALAKLWMSWGIQPQAMIGHSVGEYVAGCLAGVFSLEDALRLVAKRAALVQAQPRGSMLAVKLPLAELEPQLPPELSIAAVNSPTLCVVSGPDDAVERFEKQLAEKKVTVRHLCTSHAFHSAMMNPVLEPFTALFAGVKLNPPEIPFVSNVTAQWVTAAQTADPNYWASHLRRTVRFADGVGELVKDSSRILLEVGPGQSLSTMVRQHPARARDQVVLATLGVSTEEPSETKAMLQALGKLWLAGCAVDWSGFYAREKRHRVSLPAYPFERQKFWAEPAALSTPVPVVAGPACAVATSVPAAAGEAATTVCAPATPVASIGRKEHLTTLLRAHLRELSGMDLADVPAATNFLELGFDSLFLTQASLSLQNKFGVRITFRQMLEELSSLEALAGYLDQALAPDQFSPGVSQPVAAPATAAIPAATSPAATIQAGSPLAAFEQLLRQQLELSGQLLNLVQQNPAAAKKLASSEFAVESTQISAPPPAQPKSEGKAFGPYKPIETGPGGGLTQRQRDYLDALIARYTTRTQKSKEHTQKHRRRLADPRTVAGFRPFWKEMVYPLVMERSLGARMWDLDGNEYVDFTMGFGTNLLGHSPRFINDAIAEQLNKGLEVGPQTPLAGKVAELMCELTGMERCAFSNTGSEAVLAALRIARTVTGRNRIVYFAGDYHGIFDEVLQRSGGAGGVEQTFSIAPGIPPQQPGNLAILEYENPASLEYIRRHGGEIAAVIVEPVQSRHPDLQPAEFLRELRRVTQETGSALIFDEVITGFRSHPGGVQALFGIRADIATYGKLIGGGLPIGAVCGSAKFMDALDGGHWSYRDDSIPEVGVTFFAGTYVRHPLTIAASHAMLSHLKREGPELQRRLNERMAAVARELNQFLRERQVPVLIEHFSSFFWVRFESKIKHGSLLFFLLRDRGVHIFEGRLFFLSTAHTDADVELLVRTFKESILEMQAAGFLPETPGGIAAAATTMAALPSPLIRTEPAPPPVPRREAAVTQSIAEMRSSEPAASARRGINFSLYFFGNYPSAYTPDKYDLLIAAARFADQNGFKGIWIPERHFHPVGGFSPNPSVVAAAIARETKHLQLRAGSVVLPLHNPIRVAEEWSLVDNLSNGRVGIAIASGWHPNDFVFAPEAYEKRREICSEGLALIRKLWSGQSIPVRGGTNNPLNVTLYPMPVQRELPAWLTCVQKSSYVTAGELGTGVLAMATNQSLEEIAGKIAAYRESFARHGHAPERAHVTLLLHTYVGEDFESSLAQARGPMCDYLRSYLDNSQKRHESKGGPVAVSEEDMQYLLNRSFDDYVKGKALIGTPETCARVVEKFREIGVDEIGCFIDFGVEPAKVIESLPHLRALQQRFEAVPAAVSTGAGRNGDSVRSSANEARQIPLTESQQGLWAMLLMTPEASRAYNEVTTLRLRGPVDLDALQRALQALMHRHEALRTTIDKNGEFQTVHSQATLEMARVDLSDLSETEQASRLRAEFRQVENFAFDFQGGPAMRALVIRLDANQHLLLLTFHHLFGNGPSFIVAFSELGSLYAALTEGNPPELGPAMQLSDYVQWQDAQARSGATQADEAFWTNHLAGIPAGLDLPSDRPRPPLTTYRGGRLSMKLGRALTSGVRKAGAGLRSSMFMTLFAAHNVWLHRLSGQNDLVVGVPFEGPARSLPGGGSLFANTTNMMPLRSRVNERTTFAELVAATKSTVLEASEHQNFFFARLIEKLNLRHDLSRPPIFSVSFNYESGKFQKQFGGLNMELVLDGVPFGSPPDTAKFDLCINVAEKDGELQFDCDYNADLFDEPTIQRWLGHQKTLLEGVAADARQSIWSLPLLSDAERQQILSDWNSTEQTTPRNQFLDALFEEQVAHSPDAIAIEYEDQRLTYGELNSRANQLANHLRKLGVGPDVLVGISVEKSLELVIGLLGILKAGGAYVPLDPDYPPERQAYVLADAQAPVLLTQAHLLAELPAISAQVICLDGDWPAIAREPGTQPVLERNDESLAYVIYTSGSTGRPKGVMIPHRAICNHLLWMRRTFAPGADDVTLQKTSSSFDVSVWEFFAPLTTGGRLVLAREDGLLDPVYLTGLIQSAGVTSLQMVPSQLGALLDEPGFGACRSLRRVFCGGEALGAEMIKRFYATLPGAKLHNMYGPTEAAIDSTTWDCPSDAEVAAVAIGRPIHNARAYILDRQLQPVPIGVAGELHIGGCGLAHGYLNRPELSAEKFIPDPFAANPGRRIYKTGDLCRFRADGNIEYLGRLDFQVKVRGFRIELGEIETALSQQPGVKDVTAIMREDVPGDQRIVAYLTARAGETLDAEALRRALAQRLPVYMVPGAVVVLPQLPLNPNGKVDRRALPMPEGVSAAGESHYVAPRSPVEEKLCGIWSEVLRAKKVGIHDNFLDLGGHSLLAMQVISRVNRALSVQLPMRTFFENPTVSGLALAITQIQLEQASPDQVEQLLRELEADAPAQS